MRKFTILIALLMFMGLQSVLAQKKVSGTVTSSEDGKGIPGATVLVKSTSNGVITDVDGKYSLNVKDGKILVFSFVGMKTQEIPIENKTIINVVLEPETKSLEGVVVTAMGISREKKSLGYSTQEVKTEDLTRTGNTNLSTAMQGRVAGVEIRPSSGMPGASSQIFIRGARSFSGNNAPLYVVDGMPIASNSDYEVGDGGVIGTDFSGRSLDLNPNDIESINVLKGQAAAALYGIKASNGVILITTKSGKSVQGGTVGKPVVTYSSDYSFDMASVLPKLQHRYAHGAYSKGVIKYTNFGSGSWGPEISKIPDDPTFGGNVLDPANHTGEYWFPQKQEWVKPQSYNNAEDFFQTGNTFSNNINISQAGTMGTYSIGLGSTDQTGIIPSSGMKRYNAKLAANFNINKNWKTGFSSNYSDLKIQKIPTGNNSYLFTVYGAPPDYDLKGTPYNESGNIYKQINYRGGTFENPYWGTKYNSFSEATKRFFGNAFLNYKPYDFLDFTYKIGVDEYTTIGEDLYQLGSAKTGGATFKSTVPSSIAPSGGSIINRSLTYRNVNSQFLANFDQELSNNLKLNVLLGSEINSDYTQNMEEEGTGFIIGGYNNIKNCASVIADENKYRSRIVGFFGNASLEYQKMLYFNVTGRNDYVSTMPRNNRSFFYPSASLSWVFTELPSFQNKGMFGKIRGSYAEVGAAGTYYPLTYPKGTSTSGFLSYGIEFPLGGIVGYQPNATLYDPNLTPQNTKSWEIGLEYKIFNNRIGIDYTYASQTTKDQIFSVPLAGSTGYSYFVTNAGEMSSKSHEFTLYLIPIKTNNFEWDFNTNFSTVENKCVSLAPGVESIYLGGFQDPQVRAMAGMSYPIIYGVQYKRNDQGKIVVDEDGMPEAGNFGKIGTVSPKFIMSFNNSLKYKFVSLSFLIEWKNGGQMYSGSNRLIDLYGTSHKTGDREKTFMVDGVVDNGITNDQGIQVGGTANTKVLGGAGHEQDYEIYYNRTVSNISEAYVYKTDFVKLREISLAFDLPKRWINPIKISKLSVSAYARNILIWSNLPNFDPESSQGNGNMQGGFDYMSLPQTKSFGFGINLTL